MHTKKGLGGACIGRGACNGCITFGKVGGRRLNQSPRAKVGYSVGIRRHGRRGGDSSIRLKVDCCGESRISVQRLDRLDGTEQCLVFTPLHAEMFG